MALIADAGTELLRTGSHYNFLHFRHQVEQWYSKHNLWAMSNGSYSPTLFHYTSSRGLREIILNQCLWATHVEYLNDSQEYHYLGEILEEMIEAGKLNTFRKRLVNLLSYATKKGVAQKPNVYVSCFCTEDNLLSQWKAYGAGTSGYSIGFRGTNLVRFQSGTQDQNGGSPSKGLMMRKVIYDRKEQEEFILDGIASLQQDLDEGFGQGSVVSSKNEARQDVISETHGRDDEACIFAMRLMALEYSVCFKHPSFSEEEEWRIAFIDYGGSSHRLALSPQETSHVKTRVRGNEIVPYVEVRPYASAGPNTGKLPILTVRIGPSINESASEKVVRLLLQQQDYFPVDILRSGIPLRAT